MTWTRESWPSAKREARDCGGRADGELLLELPDVGGGGGNMLVEIGMGSGCPVACLSSVEHFDGSADDEHVPEAADMYPSARPIMPLTPASTACSRDWTSWDIVAGRHCGLAFVMGRGGEVLGKGTKLGGLSSVRWDLQRVNAMVGWSVEMLGCSERAWRVDGKRAGRRGVVR